MKTNLYVIMTKPYVSYHEITEICVRKKIKFLQLREKDLSDREYFNLICELKSITRYSETKLVVNDRLDVFLTSEADAIHLGQDDLPVNLAYPYLKRGKSLGLSTHNINQVLKANKEKLDYIGFGPVFPTFIKKNPDPVTGLKKLERALEISKHSIVAIGGINDKNLSSVLKIKPDYVAMVSYLMQTKIFSEKLNQILELLEENGG